MGDIDKALLNFLAHAAVLHPAVTPVRQKKDISPRIRCVRQHIAENTFRNQTGFNPAILAGKYPVCFFKQRRRTALGALIIYLDIDSKDSSVEKYPLEMDCSSKVRKRRDEAFCKTIRAEMHFQMRNSRTQGRIYRRSSMAFRIDGMTSDIAAGCRTADRI